MVPARRDISAKQNKRLNAQIFYTAKWYVTRVCGNHNFFKKGAKV
jgi:hypothetical protein